MKKIILSFFLIVLACNFAYSQPQGGSPPSVLEEEDGDPSGRPRTIKVTNGSLTDNGDGSFSIGLGAGSGDNVTINASAIDTTANFKDGDIVWTLTDGGAGGPDDVTGTFATDSVDDTHINWGAGAGQVDMDDVPNSATYVRLTAVKDGYINQSVVSGATPTFTGTNFTGIPDGALSSTFLKNVVEDTTPELGGNLDVNQKSLVYDPIPTADDTWNGTIITMTAGESITKNDICVLSSDGKFWRADADVEATTKGMLAMSTASYVTNDSAAFLTEGFMRDDGDFAYTVGTVLWVSLTPGDPTETIPPDVGDYVRRVGTAISADVVHFKPSGTWIKRN